MVSRPGSTTPEDGVEIKKEQVAGAPSNGRSSVASKLEEDRRVASWISEGTFTTGHGASDDHEGYEEQFAVPARIHHGLRRKLRSDRAQPAKRKPKRKKKMLAPEAEDEPTTKTRSKTRDANRVGVCAQLYGVVSEGFRVTLLHPPLRFDMPVTTRQASKITPRSFRNERISANTSVFASVRDDHSVDASTRASVRVDLSAADPASAPTSASVPAPAHESAVTPTPLSGTTEKNFSVDKYFELQEKKLELEAKQRARAVKPDSPKTVFDGSPVLSTDGGIPVDYEKGELEDEGTSSSLSYDSKPATGTRRPREDDSDALSSKRPRSVSEAVPFRPEAPAITSERSRTDGSVRKPWMLYESVITARHGCTVPPNEIPLYVDNRIVDDAEVASQYFEPMTNQMRDYYISLFHELRYWSSKKTSGRSRVPEWQALCQSWN
ncbi:hypothetical protein PHMEG_00010914 [Phytophthora megakarya]|uniref:Eukaryotic/viral aspartic protease n=1 Tax=Phytophthora megakarya TaxID=4795 RepID=A0A225WCH1_9STRA|nr:hypothetical protein PHMEG_00010914 [Phytophthora megakarya]